MNRGSLGVMDVDTVDPIAVLDANEALDVHLDVEASARAAPPPSPETPRQPRRRR